MLVEDVEGQGCELRADRLRAAHLEEAMLIAIIGICALLLGLALIVGVLPTALVTGGLFLVLWPLWKLTEP